MVIVCLICVLLLDNSNNMQIVVVGVVRPEMVMDSWFHKVELMLGERAAHGQPTARFRDC